ncbi:hypothetical protein [Methylocystis sp.]|uniref:hypothetical protein n=1 Tax=Methylocystis sp. TaxID=1911079 RepID=UPI003DA62291
MARQSHTPSRRAMLAGIAAAPVAGLPAIAGVVAEADPIFAAFAQLERAKAANKTVTEAVDELRGETWEAIEAAGLDPRVTISCRKLEERRELNFYSDEDYAAGLAKLEGAPVKIQKMLLRLDEAEDTDAEATEAEKDSECALYDTPPTTRAGALWLLRHIADFLDEDDVVNDNWVGDMIGDSIRNAIAALEREALS